MANEQNLIPWNKRSKEEQREYARKGGINSGKARQKRKSMQEQMSILLSLPFKIKDNKGNEIKKILTNLGLEEDEIDNQMAMMIALWKTALGNGKNQVSAFQAIRDTMGDKFIEQEKLNLERQKLEIEKQRLEIEKQRLELMQNEDTELEDLSETDSDIYDSD